MEQLVIASGLLEADIEQHLRLGYKLDMVMPADAPNEALLSKGDEKIRLRSRKRQPSSNANFAAGRAGMEYRDLIPGRLGGKVIASHIRLTKGGDVPDYVHYHKVKFQMIYCLAGSIRVVYEDCGEPFWLNPGDCVLQPPEIRHRVLECTAGSEVIEIGMPAVHETWVEHEIELPTVTFKPERDFSGQRFHRHIAAEVERTESNDGAFLVRDLGLAVPSALAVALNIRSTSNGTKSRAQFRGFWGGAIEFFYIIEGELVLNSYPDDSIPLKAGDSFIAPYMKSWELDCSPDIEFLQVLLTY